MLHSNLANQNLSLAVKSRLERGQDYRQGLRIALLFGDIFMVSIAFAIAYWLRFYGGITLAPEVEAEPIKYLTLVLILLPVWIVIFWSMKLYDFNILLGGTSEYALTFNACTLGMMFVVTISFFLPDIQIARSWLFQAWILSALLVCLGRFGIRRTAYRMRKYGFFVVPAVIVGTNEEAEALAMQLYESESSGLAILGFIAEESDEEHALRKSIKGIPVLGTLDSLDKTLQAYKIEEIVVATTSLSRPQLIRVSEQMNQMPAVEMRLSSGLYEILTTGMTITTKNAVPLMTMNRMRLDPIEQALKRTMDITLVLAASPFLAIVFGMIALLIRLDSPGPVFHRRRVLGVGGKTFDALKFRSMVTNGDEVLAQHPELLAELNATHKLKNDPRITKIGHFLRRTSLDELPQLINVFLGQMSLVGPRMIAPHEAAMYGEMKYNLLTVKPGLTGLWQVSGRSDLSYDERVHLDMQYIRNYSIWQDLQILFLQTIPTVLAKRGAY